MIKTILVVLCVILLASCSRFHIQKGESYYDQANYPMAVAHFNAAMKKGKNADVRFMLAECFAKMGKLDLAEQQFKEAAHVGMYVSPFHHLEYIRVLMEQGKFDQASNQLLNYTKDNTNDLSALFMFAICRSFVHENIHYPMTFLRAYWLDRPVHSNNYSNLWIQQLYQSEKKNTTVFIQKNSPFWLSPLYLRTDIVSRFENGAILQNASDLPNYSRIHPWLSSDGSRLYFIANLPNGFGGTDIYCSNFTNGQWSSPVNLGAEINTSANEFLPYSSEDGSLFFCRDHKEGLFSYITTQQDRYWLTPIQLQQNYYNPIEVKTDNLVSSDFIGSFPGALQKVNSPQIFNFYASTRWFGTQKLIKGATFRIKKMETTQTWELLSNAKGEVNLALDTGSTYVVYAMYENAFTKTDTISTIGLVEPTDFKADFEVEIIELDKPILLNSIYYDYDKFNLREEAIQELDNLVKMMKDNPQLFIEIGSHTDSRGSAQYNLTLSQNRAQSVVSYLIAKGVDPVRLSARGYGESMLLNGCSDGVKCTEEQHQLNRRTTFTVRKSL
jgi:peptidoglycan-associated lipoprotein